MPSVMGLLEERERAARQLWRWSRRKVEGVRSKAKRLAARGWPAEERPRILSVLAGRAGGS